MSVYQRVKGMRDFLPEDLSKRRYVEGKVRDCFKLYGYEEVETPILESFDLITAKAGDEIRHRMYAFQDLGGRKLALRPEITPSIARIVANKLRTEVKPLRLGYIANCFRYDNPQMGRYREFWQAGFELFGSRHPAADAEVISINDQLMKALGFSDFSIKIGHVAVLREILDREGVDEEDQNRLMALMDKGERRAALALLQGLGVSEESQVRLEKASELKGRDWEKVLKEGRVLLEGCESSISALDNLEQILSFITSLYVKGDIILDLGFARGLEYYTGMIFEVFISELDFALGGGGRYDGLVDLIGGYSMPAVGCAPGIDRIVLAMDNKNLFPEELKLFKKTLVIPVSEDLFSKSLEIASSLRELGIPAHSEVDIRGVASALSYADKKKYNYAVIVGSRELKGGRVVLRDLGEETQMDVRIPDLAQEIKGG